MRKDLSALMGISEHQYNTGPNILNFYYEKPVKLFFQLFFTIGREQLPFSHHFKDEILNQEYRYNGKKQTGNLLRIHKPYAIEYL